MPNIMTGNKGVPAEEVGVECRGRDEELNFQTELAVNTLPDGDSRCPPQPRARVSGHCVCPRTCSLAHGKRAGGGAGKGERTKADCGGSTEEAAVAVSEG